MKIFLLTAVIALLALACGMGGEKAETLKPLTVDDLNAMKKEKPDELMTKYKDRKVTVLGKVTKLPYDSPGAYDAFGFQIVSLSGTASGYPIDCQVSPAEGQKFKDVKEGDITTVTGNLRVKEFTMELENCSKPAAPNKTDG